MNRQEKKKQADLHNIIYENKKNRRYMLAFCSYMEKLFFSEEQAEQKEVSREDKREAVRRAALLALAPSVYYR